MSVSVFIKNACTTIGEGPHWEPASQSLLYVDIHSGEVHRYDMVTNRDSKIELEGPVGFVVPRKSGGYIVGVNKTLTFLDWERITAKGIAEVDVGLETRFNDGKCDASGRLWAGTMDNDVSHWPSRPSLAALYSLDRDLSLRSQVQKVTLSNGLAWTADNRTMYYIDSAPKCLYAFDFDLSTGHIENQRVAVDFNRFLQESEFPDGMSIDREDKLWVACYGAGKIVRVDPNTGSLMSTLEFPARRITSCCFGGSNYDELYVTSSRYKASPEELAAYPLAGSVFKVTGLGVRGCPAAEFNG